MDQPIFYTVKETLAALRCGRSLFYTLINEGKLKPTKLAGKTLIAKAELDRFIASLSDEAA